MGLISYNDFTWSSELQKVCEATTVSKDSTCREGSAHPLPLPFDLIGEQIPREIFHDCRNHAIPI